MEVSGKDPSEQLTLLTYKNWKASQWYDWHGNEIWCDICGKIFESQGALNFHKSSVHFNNRAMANSKSQWDYGQLDLQNGVNALWNDFMHEHDLPKMCFLYGDQHIGYSKYHDKSKWFMPFYYEHKLKDTVTGQVLDAICFNDNWLRLDPDAKLATLAHTATHIENWRAGVWDVTFNKKKHHTKMFRNTAITYDLRVFNVPEKGFAMTLLTDKFKKKHRYAVKMVNRYHHMEEMHGNRHMKCNVEDIK